MSNLPCLTLNRYAQERIKLRHPWIFSNEIADPKLVQKFGPGAIVDVLDCRGDYVGTGFVNPKSLITIRILSRTRGELIDQDFFQRKIGAALQWRETFFGKEFGGTYRAVFGESDGLPGLVIDRFEGAWVIEHHSLGLFMQEEQIVKALSHFDSKAAIVSRADTRAAQLEGIESSPRVLAGEIPKAGVFAWEDGLKFPVDPLSGQKTGYFFDQRTNRMRFRQVVAGLARREKNILAWDVYSHAGAWGLGALKAGAVKAVFVDSSAGALEMVAQAAHQAGLDKKIELVQEDAEAFLRKSHSQAPRAIALDPPALVPSKKAIPAGAKLYREINRAAVSQLKAGGVLSTSSCSYHMDEARFEELVAKACWDAGKEARLLEKGNLSPDHPGLVGIQEGRYLKNLLLGI